MQISSSFNEVYPNMEGELCNKHTIQLNRCLKHFEQLYNVEPEHIVVSKGICNLLGMHKMNLFMGIQNSVTVCFKRTGKQSQIFINSNIDEEQIILNYKGLIQKGESKSAQLFSDIYKTAIDDLSFAKIKGGVLYVESNIPKDSFNQHNSIVVAIFLAILQINDILQDNSQEYILKKLSQFNLLKDNKDLGFNNSFALKNNKLMLSLQQQCAQISVEQSQKLVFLNLNLSEQLRQLQKQKQKIAAQFNQKLSNIVLNYTGFSSLIYVTYQSQGYKKIMELTKLEGQQFANFFGKHYKLVQHLIKFQQGEANFKQLCIYSEKLSQYYYHQKLIQKCNEFRSILKTTPSFLVEKGEYLVFVCHRSNYTEAINKLSKKLLNQKKKQSIIEDNLELQQKWSNKYGIRSQVFSSFACSGLNILESKMQLEMDDLMI